MEPGKFVALQQTNDYKVVKIDNLFKNNGCAKVDPPV